jgi:hypothetical protein
MRNNHSIPRTEGVSSLARLWGKGLVRITIGLTAPEGSRNEERLSG